MMANGATVLRGAAAALAAVASLTMAGACRRSGAEAPGGPTVGRFVVDVPGNGDDVAWSPDGRLFATWGDGGLQVRDGSTALLVAVLDDWVDRALWSADGSSLVVLGYRGSWARVDLATGAITRVPVRQDRARSDFGVAAVSADGKRLVIGTQTDARLWDAETGRELAALHGHDRALSETVGRERADGNALYSVREDHSVDVFDLSTGARTRTIPIAADDVEAVAVGRGGVVAAGGIGSTLYTSDGKVSPPIDDSAIMGLAETNGVWAIATERHAALWTGAGAPTILPLGDDDRLAVYAAGGRVGVADHGSLHVFDAATARPLATIAGGVLAPDGRTAISSPGDGDPSIVDVATGGVLATWPRRRRDAPPPVVSATGDHLWIDGVLVELATGQATSSDPITAEVAVTRDGRSRIKVDRCEDDDDFPCACVANAAGVCTGKLGKTSYGDTAPWAFGPDGAAVAHVIEDDYLLGHLPSVRVYDAATGAITHKLAGEAVTVGWASRDVLAIVEKSGRVRLVRLRDGASLELVIDPKRTAVLALAPDGSYDGDPALLAHVVERDAPALRAPVRRMADDADARTRLRVPGLYAAFVRAAP